jgi:hypothetical protein
METNDIVQEYAQTQQPVAETENTNTESSLTNETPTQEVASVAPETPADNSAYEALLSGKSNVKEPEPQQEVVQETVQESVQQDVQPTVETEPTQLDTTEATDDVIDEDDFIKAKTDGKFESWEQVMQALEEQAKPKFENELSEQVYNMLLQGQTEELFEILGTKQFAEEVKTMSDEEVLKAFIKANNPEFDDDDVEAEYSESYTIDEYAFDETKLKREQKKLNQRIKSDVSEAKEFFESLAQDIKLPELSKPEVVAQQPEVDLETEQLIQEQRSKFLNGLNGVESRITNLPFQWKDEKANVAVNGKFDIPAQELSKYRTAAENLESYQVERYYKDGQYFTDKMVRDLYVADNFDKILTSAISQAVNQTRLEMLKQSKNIQSEQEPSGTFKPNAADEERTMLDKLFSGHLQRQQ